MCFIVKSYMRVQVYLKTSMLQELIHNCAAYFVAMHLVNAKHKHNTTYTHTCHDVYLS